MPRKNIDIKDFQLHEIQRFKSLLGEPNVMDKANRYEYWKQRIASLIPRSFAYVFDMKHDRVTLSHGMDFIGYNDNQPISSQDILMKTHDNHRKLLAFQAYKTHQALLQFTYDELGYDYYSGGFRAILDKNGKAWLSYCTGEIFQYDNNGQPIQHLTWQHVLAPYRDMPMYIEFFHADGSDHHEPLKKMNNLLRDIKDEQLRFLGFSRTQLEVLAYHSSGLSSNVICEQMMIKKRTLEKHNSNIIAITRDIFPAKEFRDYRDVVRYFQNQDLL